MHWNSTSYLRWALCMTATGSTRCALPSGEFQLRSLREVLEAENRMRALSPCTSYVLAEHCKGYSPHGEAIEEEERQEAREQCDKKCWSIFEELNKPDTVPYLSLLLQHMIESYGREGQGLR